MHSCHLRNMIKENLSSCGTRQCFLHWVPLTITNTIRILNRRGEGDVMGEFLKKILNFKLSWIPFFLSSSSLLEKGKLSWIKHVSEKARIVETPAMCTSWTDLCADIFNYALLSWCQFLHTHTTYTHACDCEHAPSHTQMLTRVHMPTFCCLHNFLIPGGPSTLLAVCRSLARRSTPISDALRLYLYARYSRTEVQIQHFLDLDELLEVNFPDDAAPSGSGDSVLQGATHMAVVLPAGK